MRSLILGLALIAFSAGVSNAQGTPQGTVTFFDTAYEGGLDVATVIYEGPENPNLRLYEAVLSGPVERCFDNFNFSRARLVSSDRAVATWDHLTNTYTVNWTFRIDTKDTCRVLIGDGDGQVDGSDFLIWQRNLGSTALFQGDLGTDVPFELRSGDGSVRSVSYSISVGGWY